MRQSRSGHRRQNQSAARRRQIRRHHLRPAARVAGQGNGYPLLLLDRYGKGILYVLAVPDNFADFYRLPPATTSALRSYLLHGFPVRVDGPAQVALFAYDNNTFIVESFLPTAADVNISVAGTAAKLRNLVTGEILTGQPPPAEGFRRRQAAREERMVFHAQLPPHSYAVFAVEK